MAEWRGQVVGRCVRKRETVRRERQQDRKRENEAIWDGEGWGYLCCVPSFMSCMRSVRGWVSLSFSHRRNAVCRTNEQTTTLSLWYVCVVYRGEGDRSVSQSSRFFPSPFPSTSLFPADKGFFPTRFSFAFLCFAFLSSRSGRSVFSLGWVRFSFHRRLSLTGRTPSRRLFVRFFLTSLSFFVSLFVSTWLRVMCFIFHECCVALRCLVWFRWCHFWSGDGTGRAMEAGRLGHSWCGWCCGE